MSAEPKNGAVRLNLWLGIGASVFTFLVSVFVGGYWLSNLSERLNSLEKNTGQAQLHEMAVAQQRKLDRLDGQVRSLDGQVSVISTSSCQQFAKVETQFGTVETILNDMRVDDLRVRAGFWEKLYKQPYSNAFYEIKIPHEVTPCK